MRDLLVESGDRHVEGGGGRQEGTIQYTTYQASPGTGKPVRVPPYYNPLFVFKFRFCELRDMNLITGNPICFDANFSGRFHSI